MTESIAFKGELSLIIVTCDLYSDVLEVLLNKLTQLGILDAGFYNVIVASDRESSAVNYKKYGIKDVVYSECWGGRLHKAASIVNTDMCLVILDDYIPYSSIDLDLLSELVSSMGEDVDCAYLSSVFKTVDGSSSKLIPGYYMLPENALYRVNTAAAIWRASSLLKVIQYRDSPWEWEAFSGYRPAAKKMQFFAPISPEYQLYKYCYETGGNVYRGAWVNDSLIKCGISIDEVLQLSKRPVIYEIEGTKRSIVWKIKFLYTGFSMVGFNVLFFLVKSIQLKISKLMAGR